MAKSLINWKPFTAFDLPKKWTEMLLLMCFGGLKNGTLSIVTDCWTGTNLTQYPENSALAFCSYDDLNFSKLQRFYDKRQN